MRYISRLLGERILRLFRQFPAVAVIGARQVGKSTLLEHLFPQVPRIIFDPVHDVHNAKEDPELFLNNHLPPLILDEVQYVPQLIPVLKRRIDAAKHRRGQYLLTGSQQWGVLKEMSESLAGRVALVHLDGFCLPELAVKAASWLEAYLSRPHVFPDGCQRLALPHLLYEQLWRGFFPAAQDLDLDLIPDFHRSYQQTYIEKDVRQIGQVTDIAQFSRFVRLVSALAAQEINYSQIGREIDITPQTAKRWLQLLEQTFMWFEVPAYSNNAVKKISLKPKGYCTDTGQLCFSQMISSKDALGGHPLWGSIFENAVASEIRKLCQTMSTAPQIYHWRSHSGSECDLILERDGMLFPIEIKSKTRPSARDARGIEAFRRAYPEQRVQRGLIIAPSESAWPVTDDVWVMPWDMS